MAQPSSSRSRPSNMARRRTEKKLCRDCSWMKDMPPWLENVIGRELKCRHLPPGIAPPPQPTTKDLMKLCKSFRKLSVRDSDDAAKSVPSTSSPVPTRLVFSTTSSLRQRRISFLDLPAELRNKVYQFHLVENRPHRIFFNAAASKLEPVLLRTHSQIRREVSFRPRRGRLDILQGPSVN